VLRTLAREQLIELFGEGVSIVLIEWGRAAGVHAGPA
jgi:hypothetical protein